MPPLRRTKPALSPGATWRDLGLSSQSSLRSQSQHRSASASASVSVGEGGGAASGLGRRGSGAGAGMEQCLGDSSTDSPHLSQSAGAASTGRDCSSDGGGSVGGCGSRLAGASGSGVTYDIVGTGDAFPESTVLTPSDATRHRSPGGGDCQPPPRAVASPASLTTQRSHAGGSSFGGGASARGGSAMGSLAAGSLGSAVSGHLQVTEHSSARQEHRDDALCRGLQAFTSSKSA